MTARKRAIAGLAQPRAPRPKTIRKELVLTDELAEATISAASAAGVTWTAWVTAALQSVLTPPARRRRA